MQIIISNDIRLPEKFDNHTMMRMSYATFVKSVSEGEGLEIEDSDTLSFDVAGMTSELYKDLKSCRELKDTKITFFRYNDTTYIREAIKLINPQRS